MRLSLRENEDELSNCLIVLVDTLKDYSTKSTILCIFKPRPRFLLAIVNAATPISSWKTENDERKIRFANFQYHTAEWLLTLNTGILTIDCSDASRPWQLKSQLILECRFSNEISVRF